MKIFFLTLFKNIIFIERLSYYLIFHMILMRQVIDFNKLYKLEEKSILETDTRKFVQIIYFILFKKVLLFLIIVYNDVLIIL
jgi:hypothetical protein